MKTTAPASALKPLILLATLTLCAASSRIVGAESTASPWPQFRGPSGQGIAQAKDLPLEWGEGKNVAWKTPIHGKAWSSPVVLNGQVWMTTATADGKQLSVVCVGLADGKIVHDLKLLDVANPQYCHPFNSYASPSPVAEATPDGGGRIYVSFGSPGTACLDAKTGKVFWERRDFVCNHWRGAGSSPSVWNDLLFLNFDGSDLQYLAALDKNTGKTVWKTDRSIDFQDLDANGKPQAEGDWRKAYSTPRVGTFGGKPMLLSLGSKCFYAYDPATGKEIWRAENRGAHSPGNSPTFGPDLIYFCFGNGKNELWAVKPGGTGVLGDADVAWKAKKNVPTRSSVLLADDLLFLVDDGGIASCLEAKTGTEVWKQRLGGTFSASPLLAAGRVYFFSEDGKTTVVETGRTFKKLAENQLDAGFMATPAVVDGALLLRTKTHLYRVESAK